MPIQDAYSHLEVAVEELIARLGNEHSEYRTAFLYQAQLYENIQLSRMHGDTEQRRADRSIILQKFINLSLDNFGVTLSDLCPISNSFSKPVDSALHNAEEIIHSESYYRDVKRLFDLGKVESLAREYTSRLILSIATTLSQEIAQSIIKTKIDDWKVGRIKTLKDLIDSVEIQIDNYSHSDDTHQKIKLLVNEWYEAFAMDLYRLLSPIYLKYHLVPTIPSLNVDNDVLDKILLSVDSISLEQMSAKELDFMNSLEKYLPVKVELAKLLGIGTGTATAVALIFLSFLSALPIWLGSIIITLVSFGGAQVPTWGLNKFQEMSAQKLLTTNLPIGARKKITQEHIADQLQIIQHFFQERAIIRLKNTIKPSVMLNSARETLFESTSIA